MFTIAQIKAAHSKVQSGADFPRYMQDLILLGVIKYTTHVADGHTVYYSSNGAAIASDPIYPPLSIAADSKKRQFAADLKNHQQGNTSYPQFCSDCAASGIEQWVVDMQAMTCTYFDTSGNAILEEKIPVPAE